MLVEAPATLKGDVNEMPPLWPLTEHFACFGLLLSRQCEDNNILYGFLRLTKTDDGGDSKRVKFVFLTWVGESASPLKKGKVTVHKKECAVLFKVREDVAEGAEPTRSIRQNTTYHKSVVTT